MASGDMRQPGANLVAFQVSSELMRRARQAVAAVRRDPADRPKVAVLVEILVELTDRGMDFYYMEPLRRCRAGAMATSAARVGLAAAGRGLPTIIRRVVSSLDEDQIREIADCVDEMLITTRKGGG